MTVLAIITAAVLIVLVALLLMPVVVHITYGDTLGLRLSYAGFTIPTESEKPKKKQKKKSAPKTQNTKKKSKNKLSFDNILELVKIGFNAAEKLLKTIRIKRLRLAVIVSGEDAATAAINYGRVCALASATYPLIENSVDKKHTDISVDLQYESQTSVNADIVMKAMTLKLLVIAVKVLIAALPIINNKNKKGGASNECSK